MKKINIILPMLTVGGGVKVVYELANRLMADNDYEVVIYSPIIAFWNKSFSPYQILSWLYVTLRNVLSPKKVKWFKVKARVVRPLFLKEEIIEAAWYTIATSWQTAYFVNNLPQSTGKKIYFIQGYEVWSGINPEIVHKTYNFKMEKITVSKWLAKKISLISGQKIKSIVYPAIDTTAFFPDVSKDGDGRPVLLAMYHSLKVKGFDDVLRVFSRVRKRIPSLKLVIFGIRKGGKVRTNNDVEFFLRPSKQELRKLYSRATVFLSTSKSEGFGLTPLEAMACGCPVVATNVGVINEIGTNGYNCLKAKVGEVTTLSKQVIKVIGDENLRNKMKKNGLATVKKFDWEKSTAKFVEYLRKAN